MARTPATSVVIPPELKEAAATKAATEYRTLSDVIVAALYSYVNKPAPGSVAWQVANAPAGSAHGTPDLREE